MNAESILKLPLAIQVALGGGYLAYLIAYAGLRQHHTATDVIFRSIAFGLAASAVLVWVPVAIVIRVPLALLAACFCGAVWRWRGRLWMRALLRVTNVTWAEDTPKAWLNLIADRTDCRVSQICVEIDDGRILQCGDTTKFTDSPFAPCLLGLDGDIAMYVTDERRTDGEWITHEAVKDAFYGDNITYIPREHIRRLELRLWTKKSNGSVEVAEGEEATAAEAEKAL